MIGREGHRRLILLTLVITGFAALLRMAFVLAVLASSRLTPPERPWSPDASAAQYPTGYLMNDSGTYLDPAHEALRGHLAGIGTLLRPPGYPAFLALLGTSPGAVLVAQALLGALIAAAGVLLTYMLTQDVSLSGGAGLVLAVSPTGIGLTGLIMADLLLSVVFAIGLSLLVASVRYRRTGWLHLAGLVFGLGVLVKPVLFAWAPFSVLVAWLVAGGSLRFAPIRAIMLFVVLQLAPAGIWAACNYARDGVFTVSSIGPITARLYLGSQTMAWARAHHRPDAAAVTRLRADAWKQLDSLWQLDSLDAPREQIRWAKATTLQILRANPKAAVHAYLDNLNGSTGGEAWSYFPSELVSYPAAHGALKRLARLEAETRRLGRWLLLACVAAAITTIVLARQRPLPQLALDVCALAVPMLFFLVFSGITSLTGPRIMYPASAAAVAMGAVALRGMGGLRAPARREMVGSAGMPE